MLKIMHSVADTTWLLGFFFKPLRLLSFPPQSISVSDEDWANHARVNLSERTLQTWLLIGIQKISHTWSGHRQNKYAPSYPLIVKPTSSAR